MRDRGRLTFGGSLEISASLQISPHARLRAENIALLSTSTKLRERMRADKISCSIYYIVYSITVYSLIATVIRVGSIVLSTFYFTTVLYIVVKRNK